MGRFELPGYLHFQAEEQGLLLTHSQPTTGHSMLASVFPTDLPSTGGLTLAVLAPAASQLNSLPNRHECLSWGSAMDSFTEPSSLGIEDSRRLQAGKMETLYKLGSHQGTNSRLGNLQFSSNGHSLQLLPHNSFGGKLQSSLNHNMADVEPMIAAAAADISSQQCWEDRTSSPYRGSSLIGSYRPQEVRDNSSSPFSSYSSSPRGIDFRIKRHSSSGAIGTGSPRTPTHGACGHRIGIDPRLVVGSPLEVAWEVLQQNPSVASLLNLQPGTAKLRNLPVQEDEESEVPNEGAAAAREGVDTPLTPEQLTHEQGLVRSCRGLPARVRDDLIKAARLAVTRRDSNGRELPGTGLLPFFFRVQSNLKWLLQQPATLKGQLLPGQIDFITEEQRGLSFQKTIQQRVRLGELAVMLHQMLQVHEGSAQSDQAAPT